MTEPRVVRSSTTGSLGDAGLGQDRNTVEGLTQLASRSLHVRGSATVRPDELQPPPQRAMCTGDEHCKAECDEHFGDCPVERELRDTFGF